MSARVDKPKKTSLRFEHLQDPLVLILETESGVRVDDEIFVNCQFGYDIRCEAVGEKGTVSLGDQNAIVVRDGVGVRNAIARDHNDRFWGAFVTEVQEWINGVAVGEHTGSTTWDGYAAACVCDAGVKALTDDGVVAGRDDREARLLRVIHLGRQSDAGRSMVGAGRRRWCRAGGQTGTERPCSQACQAGSSRRT